MRKFRFGTCLLTATLLSSLLLSGCGGTAEKPANQSAAPKTSAVVSADPSHRVAMLTNAPINDGGWNTACYTAMTDAAADLGWETHYTENVAQSDYVTTMANYAMQGFDLIIAPGNEFTDAVIEVAATYPDARFVINDGDVAGDNYTSVTSDKHQTGFMAGAAAALQSKTGNIGFVGPVEVLPTTQMREGYTLGAQYINPDIQIHNAMAGSFGDTAKGKEIAISMITSNSVDVFYGSASAVDAGVRAAFPGYDDVWSIGQPADILDDDPDHIILCTLTDTARLYGIAMEDIVADTFGGEIIRGSLGDDVLGLGRFGDSFSEESRTRMEEVVAELKAGSVQYKPEA